MNQVFLLGRLTRDPVLTKTSTGKSVCNFDVAVQSSVKNELGEYESNFFHIVSFEKTAENIVKFFKKGNQILVTGELKQDCYTARDGTKRENVKIILQKFDFIDPRNKQDQPQVQQDDPYSKFAPEPEQKSNNLPQVEEDGLPF